MRGHLRTRGLDRSLIADERRAVWTRRTRHERVLLLDQLAQHVVGASPAPPGSAGCARERRDDHLVGEPLGGDPRRRRSRRARPSRSPRRRASARAAQDVARAAARREREQRRRRGARRRSPGARRAPRSPTSLASAVRIAESAVRSIAARAGSRPAASAGPRRESIASVAEPPLPNASTRPPRAKRARSAAAAARSSSAPSPTASARAARPTSSAFIEHRARARRRRPRSRSSLLLGRGTGRGSSTRRCRAAPLVRPSSRPRWSKKTCTSSHSTW